ncbi:MAG TPA: hypothetical protein VGX16_00090 [Solirubrobacteraceae bacterium]|nr:hypothetical protein [Solirubrobacteraceae bacterium]
MRPPRRSARPPRRPFASLDIQPERPPARRARNDYTGPARVEAYTVAYEREGVPGAAILSALTLMGEHVILPSTDQELIDAVIESDPIGRPVELTGAQGAEPGAARFAG